jgi:hypothetical protein
MEKGRYKPHIFKSKNFYERWYCYANVFPEEPWGYKVVGHGKSIKEAYSNYLVKLQEFLESEIKNQKEL